jgi:hypothetical protein
MRTEAWWRHVIAAASCVAQITQSSPKEAGAKNENDRHFSRYIATLGEDWSQKEAGAKVVFANPNGGGKIVGWPPLYGLHASIHIDA